MEDLQSGDDQVIEHFDVDQVQRGATIFLTSHVLEVVERLCDDVVVMAEGKFLTRGSFDEVTADRRVQECYLGVQLS